MDSTNSPVRILFRHGERGEFGRDIAAGEPAWDTAAAVACDSEDEPAGFVARSGDFVAPSKLRRKRQGSAKPRDGHSACGRFMRSAARKESAPDSRRIRSDLPRNWAHRPGDGAHEARRRVFAQAA